MCIPERSNARSVEKKLRHDRVRCEAIDTLVRHPRPVRDAALGHAWRGDSPETWYVCDRAHGSHGEPSCQSIAGMPVDEAIGELIAAKMTPAAVELALEIRKEIEARHEEADRLRLRAVERARIEADLAQRRFMLVDPNNRLVADTLEREWNDKRLGQGTRRTRA